jgi:hypothetical protein
MHVSGIALLVHWTFSGKKSLLIMKNRVYTYYCERAYQDFYHGLQHCGEDLSSAGVHSLYVDGIIREMEGL